MGKRSAASAAVSTVRVKCEEVAAAACAARETVREKAWPRRHRARRVVFRELLLCGDFLYMAAGSGEAALRSALGAQGKQAACFVVLEYMGKSVVVASCAAR